jgi:hypothetical protein
MMRSDIFSRWILSQIRMVLQTSDGRNLVFEIWSNLIDERKMALQRKSHWSMKIGLCYWTAGSRTRNCELQDFKLSVNHGFLASEDNLFRARRDNNLLKQRETHGQAPKQLAIQ